MAITLSPAGVISLDASDIEVTINSNKQSGRDNSINVFNMKIVFTLEGLEKLQKDPGALIKLVTNHNNSFKTYKKKLGRVSEIRENTIKTEVTGMHGEDFRINIFGVDSERRKLWEYNHRNTIKDAFFRVEKSDIEEIYRIDPRTVDSVGYVTIFINENMPRQDEFVKNVTFRGLVLPAAFRQALLYYFFERPSEEMSEAGQTDGNHKFTRESMEESDFKPLYSLAMKYSGQKKDEEWQDNPYKNADSANEFINKSVDGLVKQYKLSSDFLRQLTQEKIDKDKDKDTDYEQN